MSELDARRKKNHYQKTSKNLELNSLLESRLPRARSSRSAEQNRPVVKKKKKKKNPHQHERIPYRGGARSRVIQQPHPPFRFDTNLATHARSRRQRHTRASSSFITHRYPYREHASFVKATNRFASLFSAGASSLVVAIRSRNTVPSRYIYFLIDILCSTVRTVPSTVESEPSLLPCDSIHKTWLLLGLGMRRPSRPLFAT